MASEPQTFRDHALSLLQSAADAADRTTTDVRGLAGRPDVESDLVPATAAIGALKMQGAAIPEAAPAGILQRSWDCAKLGYDLLLAKIAGNTAEVQRLHDVLTCSTCDENWARALTSYLGYYGPNGKLKTIPYIRAGQIGPKVLPLQAGAKVALIADWGTGTDVAVDLLKEVAQQKPDVLIHLGDIYYSGTAAECDVNFRRVVDTVLGRGANPIPVFTLSGNHDMYSGGAGFYGLLTMLNQPPMQQPASFFCLRSTDNHWQFVAMDTGKNDYNPFSVTTVLTSLEADEEDWLVARIGEFAGNTILLSHHQLFSALSQIGRPKADGSLVAYNPYLAVSFRRFADAAPGRIAAWFWGHEHALNVYKPYLGLERGRCIGHGAVPVFTASSPDTGPAGIINPPELRDEVHLGTDGPVYRHGFTMIQLGTDGSATAEYYDSSSGTQPIFTEDLVNGAA
jgi:hypothetical protein